MRCVRIVLTGLCGLLVTGCVSSIQPHVPENAVRFSPELLGTWSDSAATERAVITPAGARQYTVVYTDDRNETKRFLGTLGRVGQHQVLDLQISDPEKSGDDSTGTHFALVLDAVGPRIAIALLEPDSLKRYLRANPAVVAHRFTKDEVVFTATSADLANFLASYLQRPGVLGESSRWVRRSP